MTTIHSALGCARTICALILTAALGAGSMMAAASEFADKVTIALNPESSGLVAAFNTDSNLQMVSAKMHDGLLDYDAKLQPVPALAESWRMSEDGKTITFNLRNGVKWHDGVDFTSADVKFTLEKVLSKLNPRGRATFANVLEVATPDARTAVLKLSAPAPYLMNGLAAFESPMLPKHIYDDGQELLRHPALAKPVGTGPFMFGEWQKGSHILLKRNPNYWAKGLPKLGQVVFRVIPDPLVRGPGPDVAGAAARDDTSGAAGQRGGRLERLLPDVRRDVLRLQHANRPIQGCSRPARGCPRDQPRRPGQVGVARRCDAGHQPDFRPTRHVPQDARDPVFVRREEGRGLAGGGRVQARCQRHSTQGDLRSAALG